MSTYDNLNRESSLSLCKRCGTEKLVIKWEAPHFALRCEACGAWQKWVSKSVAHEMKPAVAAVEAKTYKPVGESLQPSLDMPPARCGHCPEIDRLTKALTGIERELIVVVRALMGTGR